VRQTQSRKQVDRAGTATNLLSPATESCKQESSSGVAGTLVVGIGQLGPRTEATRWLLLSMCKAATP
jgi:hypothetical protein